MTISLMLILVMLKCAESHSMLVRYLGTLGEALVFEALTPDGHSIFLMV